MANLDCTHSRRPEKKKAVCKSRKEELFMKLLSCLYIKNYGNTYCLTTTSDSHIVVGLTLNEIEEIGKIKETEY